MRGGEGRAGDGHHRTGAVLIRVTTVIRWADDTTTPATIERLADFTWCVVACPDWPTLYGHMDERDDCAAYGHQRRAKRAAAVDAS